MVSMLIFCMYTASGVTCDIQGPIYQTSSCIFHRDRKNEIEAKKDTTEVVRRWTCRRMVEPKPIDR